jgi:hypothetical protein
MRGNSWVNFHSRKGRKASGRKRFRESTAGHHPDKIIPKGDWKYDDADDAMRKKPASESARESWRAARAKTTPAPR